MEDIIKAYLQVVKDKHRLPSYSDLYEAGITKSQIKNQFVNLGNLHSHIHENHQDQINEHVAHESVIFSKKKLEQLSEDIKVYKRFFVTTAVTSKALDENFYASIQNYLKKQKAKLLILPCADISKRSKVAAWVFDPLLKDETFIHKDVALNENLFLSSIKMSAKHINPTTGLSRIGQRNGSYIFASPKQFLEHVATSPEDGHLPHAIMTPGCITVPDYHTDRYMSERVSYIAENDHVMGGIIVEIADAKTFHFRQVQADENGSFIDLGVQYNADGTTEKVSADLVMGDYHVGWTDETVKKCTAEMCKTMQIENIFVHDFFDGRAISRYDINLPLRLAIKSEEQNNSLLKEFQLCGKELRWLAGLVPGKIIQVKGNHDERLIKWLMAGEYVRDPVNHYIALELAKKTIEGEDPLKYAIMTHGEAEDLSDRVVWLSRNDSYKIGEVECGAHGDLGSNGTFGSLASAERAYGNCIVGHSHAAAILRGVWRVGTSTKIKLDYNVGPSSWTQTHALIYPNGARQLVSVIRGAWKI